MKKNLFQQEEDCTKCGQTKANCECHIPDEVKHKGLYDFIKELLKSKKLKSTNNT